MTAYLGTHGAPAYCESAPYCDSCEQTEDLRAIREIVLARYALTGDDADYRAYKLASDLVWEHIDADLCTGLVVP